MSEQTTPEAPGRPREVEEFANLLFIHPISRAVVDRLVTTRITPNAVSLSGVVAAAAAASCFVQLRPLAGTLLGSSCLLVWHVLDGADGDLARRTGRASPGGELLDGVCDHLSQAFIYLSLAFVLGRTFGPTAWVIAAIAALSHTIQANAYEAGRKNYRLWVYGVSWMKQRPDASASPAGLANRIYLAAAKRMSPGEDLVECEMTAAIARGHRTESSSLYKAHVVRLVKHSGLLGSTGRSVAVTASLLMGSPLWFFLYEILVLNAALACVTGCRSRINRELAQALGRLRAKL